MTSDVQQLEKLAADAEEKAAAAREKMEEKREKELALRRKRERDLDRQILATATETRERLREESAALYQAILAAAEELPVVRAIAAFRAAKAAEWSYLSTIANAQTRLGLEVRTFSPELREVAVASMIDQAVRNVASRLSAEAEEAHAAERDAWLSGDEGGPS